MGPVHSRGERGLGLLCIPYRERGYLFPNPSPFYMLMTVDMLTGDDPFFPFNVHLPGPLIQGEGKAVGYAVLSLLVASCTSPNPPASGLPVTCRLRLASLLTVSMTGDIVTFTPGPLIHRLKSRWVGRPSTLLKTVLVQVNN